jgi:hypothetical protein
MGIVMVVANLPRTPVCTVGRTVRTSAASRNVRFTVELGVNPEPVTDTTEPRIPDTGLSVTVHAQAAGATLVRTTLAVAELIGA